MEASDMRTAVPASARRCRETDADELELAIRAAKAGSADALRYLYCRYSDTVRTYVGSIVRNEHDAEDVTHSVFAKLMATRLARYEPRAVPFSAWLLRVARNAALDHRRAQKDVPVDDVRASDTPRDATNNVVRLDGLREALTELNDDQRRVVTMRHIAGLTPPEIASRLNTTEASVHGLHHRGRTALRRALAERGIRPTVRAGG